MSSRYVDPVVAGLVALVVYSLHGLQGSLDRDQATFVYGGVRFAHGTPPYRGIFNSVGPLGDMVAGVGIRIGWLLGLDEVTGARLAYLVLSAACVAGVSVLAREALRSRAAGVLAPAVFVTFASFLKLATSGPREKTVMVLCLEVALVLLLHRRWFGAGVLTALATLTWQPVLLAAAAAALVAILTSGAPRLRSIASYVVGGAVPTALFAAYFLAEGALRDGVLGIRPGERRLHPTAEHRRELAAADRRLPLVPRARHLGLAVLGRPCRRRPHPVAAVGAPRRSRPRPARPRGRCPRRGRVELRADQRRCRSLRRAAVRGHRPRRGADPRPRPACRPARVGGPRSGSVRRSPRSPSSAPASRR